jgi:hypothetical protein
MDRAESYAAVREAWTASGVCAVGARSAAGIEVMTAEQADAFEAQFDQAVTRNLTMTFFITAGTANE